MRPYLHDLIFRNPLSAEVPQLNLATRITPVTLLENLLMAPYTMDPYLEITTNPHATIERMIYLQLGKRFPLPCPRLRLPAKLHRRKN